MSKKIAEGTGALVLDVKVGSGAFMKTVERRPRAGPHHGRAWAPTHGVRTVALLTAMATPLGLAVGQRPRGRASRSRCWPAAAPPTWSS